MKENVMDIIERFQMHRALQEERKMEYPHASGNGAVPPRAPDELKNSLFESEGVGVSTVAVPGQTDWLPPHDGRDRLIVTLGKIGQRSPGESDPAFPARWTWIPANSDFKVPNKAHQTKDLLVIEFNEADRQR